MFQNGVWISIFNEGRKGFCPTRIAQKSWKLWICWPFHDFSSFPWFLNPEMDKKAAVFQQFLDQEAAPLLHIYVPEKNHFFFTIFRSRNCKIVRCEKWFPWYCKNPNDNPTQAQHNLYSVDGLYMKTTVYTTPPTKETQFMPSGASD